MKIAHVVSRRDDVMFRIGATLSKVWAEQGHTTDIIYWHGPPGDGGAEIHCIKAELFGLTRHSLPSRLVRSIGRLLFGHRLARVIYARLLSPQMDRLIARQGYDIVLLHDTHYFRFHRIHHPHIAVVHNQSSFNLLRGATGTKRALLQSAYAGVYRRKHIVTVSDGIRDDLIRNFGAAPVKTTRIYNPLDTEVVRAQGEGSPSPHPRPYILGAGRLAKQKNFALLIKAYAEVACNEDLVILGKGKEKSALHDLAKELGIQDKVHLAGFQPNPYPWFRHARLFVLSSDYEGFAMVILEALACGTPVVSTDCPSGPGEILRHCGLQDHLVPVGDAATMSEKITETLAQPPDLAGIHAKLEIFRPDVVAKQYILAMDAALKNTV